MINVGFIDKVYEGDPIDVLDFTANPIIGLAPLRVDFNEIVITTDYYGIDKVYYSEPHYDSIQKTY